MRLVRDALLEPDVKLADRMTELAVSALLQLPQIDGTADRPLNSLLVVCTPEPRPGLPAKIAETVGAAISQRLRRTNLRVQSLAQGHAAGLVGFGLAAKALDEGRADVAAVVGVDSYHDINTLGWMDETGQLKSEVNRDGFFPGEGAGACLLVRADVAKALRLTPLARLTAISTALETITINSEEVCVGEGLSAAFLGLAPVVEAANQQITDTYCDLNGQRYRSEELVYSAMRANHLFAPEVETTHPADCWGDVGASSGPLFVSLALAASQKGYCRGSRAALWAGSGTGRRAVALLDFPAANPEAA
ncbi:3-oxoacyl-[acyl-carrier-protein] synthase-1 [Mesorhizobium sangaii]|uniref:3-oxoacyl-[acyl-carrier-protein] synthase-1 n=2 Tax=Mesorhizobium sangaii TaxID=505389 RepID=A0A841NZZ5_9HYPH|nr:3-oxoacyl-[acyl-carrier-protein] synthase-1 [Mesorhizobium sangaii]